MNPRQYIIDRSDANTRHDVNLVNVAPVCSKHINNSCENPPDQHIPSQAETSFDMTSETRESTFGRESWSFLVS